MESGKVPFGNLIGFSVFLQDIEAMITNAANPIKEKYVKSFLIFKDEVLNTSIKRS
jgi:hypothetical protein